MQPELIVMLTHKDKTVDNALELFNEMKDTPVTHWGFKDVGRSSEDMKEIVEAMNAAGKTTSLEVVQLSEEDGLKGAKIAVECGFDMLMGTFFESVNDYLKDKAVKYYPFPGHVHGHPAILDGSIDEIVQHARLLESKGVAGLDLLSYRFTGNAATLLTEVVKSVSIPVISAGSVESYERIAEVRDTGAWGFTIGTAFFEKKFIADGSFSENMMTVWNWLEKNGR
jgi:hypothetical protein